MTLRPDTYIDRLADETIQEALKVFGAVLIEGPKWCGKTWSALNQAESMFAVADPANGFANKRLAQTDPAVALEGARPRVIDEWQEVPQLWDAARFVLDQAVAKGQFIFTGSASPAPSSTMHSGAGRFGRVRLWPMSLAESGDSDAAISLRAILDGADIKPTPGRITLPRLTELVARGGWPDALGFTPTQGQVLARSYLDTIANTDMTSVDGVRRDPRRTIALLASLARNTATTVSDVTVRRDIAQFGPAELSPMTLRSYLDVLERLFVLVSVPAWTPGTRSRTRLRVAPKRLLVDPSLAAAALGASPTVLTEDLNTIGLLFESLCLRDLSVYCTVAGASLFHYRDDAGLEADAIIIRRDGSWAAVEIMLGANQVDSAAQNLIALSRKLGEGGERPPSGLIVVTGVGGVAQRRADGVCVVPVDRLGP